MTSIYETVSEYLLPHAFTVVGGNSVRLNSQDNLKFLQNKLKARRMTHVIVSYFDGKREFSAEELKSVIVIGDSNDKNLVFRTLDAFHS